MRRMKMNKILIVGLIICSCQFANASDTNNNQNSINTMNKNIFNNNNNPENYSLNINAINNKSELNQKIKQEYNDINEYYIPIQYDMKLQTEELTNFINNIRQNPALLSNAQRILNNLIEDKDFVNELMNYMHMLLQYDYNYYKSKVNNMINSGNCNNNVQYVALINEWFHNVSFGHNYKQYIPNRANIANYTWDITCRFIVKMIRTINLISDLNKSTFDASYDVKNKNNILTFMNSNGKCAFVSMFQLFVTAFNNSKPGDKIRNTNFARFINYLHRKKNDLAPERKENSNISQYFKPTTKYDYYDYGVQFNKMPSSKIKHNFELSQLLPKLHTDYISKNNKSNIDLFSELILWCSNDNNWYKINDNKYNVPEKDQRINDITSIELQRRNEALQLIAESRDVFDYYDRAAMILVTLHLFPELKHFFGSKLANGIEKLTYQIESYSIDNAKLEQEYIAKTQNEINNTDRKMQEIAEKELINCDDVQKYYKLESDKKSNEKSLKKDKKIFQNLNLSSFNNFDKNYLNTSEVLQNFYNNILETNDFITQLSSKDYLFFTNKSYTNYCYNINELVKGYKYITKFNINGSLEIYELIGMGLGTSGHAVAFVKNNNAINSSWNAIDDNSGRFNDNNCKLTDVIYNESLYEIPFASKTISDIVQKVQQDKSNNTYIAKLCKYYKIKVNYLLYKKMSFSELPNDIQRKITEYKKYYNINNDKYRKSISNIQIQNNNLNNNINLSNQRNNSRNNISLNNQNYNLQNNPNNNKYLNNNSMNNQYNNMFFNNNPINNIYLNNQNYNQQNNISNNII